MVETVIEVLEAADTSVRVSCLTIQTVHVAVWSECDGIVRGYQIVSSVVVAYELYVHGVEIA